jgi:hypothetical protein
MTKHHPARGARTITGAASVIALIGMVVGFQSTARTEEAAKAVTPDPLGTPSAVPTDAATVDPAVVAPAQPAAPAAPAPAAPAKAPAAPAAPAPAPAAPAAPAPAPAPAAPAPAPAPATNGTSAGSGG